MTQVSIGCLMAMRLVDWAQAKRHGYVAKTSVTKGKAARGLDTLQPSLVIFDSYPVTTYLTYLVHQ
ncbi:hypothetical protein M0657_006069 [Pyricularia oryzae]|uniref:Uncharacterized protein n=1 Tax=Pyricularia oryzae TaxID=318829 RepID=A0A4P7NU57_PYROR|nr:hypothetical protein M9X92_005456 [Pyricularia oryzae]KAI7921516.1 hypothetical protein M0657_006069 [Pyricularia oryzae]QBZ65993.1 hypothetical protein PoMZ_12960 [Pyricularia oryzae]